MDSAQGVASLPLKQIHDWTVNPGGVSHLLGCMWDQREEALVAPTFFQSSGVHSAHVWHWAPWSQWVHNAHRL